MRAAALAPALGAASGAAAGPPTLTPTLFDAAPAAGPEALAVRARLETAAATAGALAVAAKGVEVVALDATGAWRRVDLGDGSGRVALEGLTPRAEVRGAGRLPADLRCCSDGTSDRVFGLSATAILEGGAEPGLLAGCGSIAP